MRIIFVSNFFNHHQKELCDNLLIKSEDDFVFYELSNMPRERINLRCEIERESYVIKVDLNDRNSAISFYNDIHNADIAILGSRGIQFIKERCGRLTFLYNERWYKNGFTWWKWPVRLIRHQFSYGIYKNTYALCASAYAASDFAKTGLFINKSYKWGYFPVVNHNVNVETLIDNKIENSILWVGRLIDWKHPEISIFIAKRLKSEGYNFKLSIIGTGDYFSQIEELIQKNELREYVQCLGAMSPESVRKHMEQSQIFLFTSDFNEGWGAVLNESMNSGCAVVASHAIGSVPFLLKDDENGLIYENGNTESCYQKVKYLLEHPKERKRLGKNAYHTLCDNWNAEVAAERLIKLSKSLLGGENHPDLFEDGPCSKARLLRNSWYKT